MPNTALLKKAHSFVRSARHICVLTGAGVSAASGIIKTFRDAGGLWEDHRVEQVATLEGFREDPALVWRFYNARRKAADVASPNAAHLALARMELGLRRQAKASFTILTQNIDGLHQQAGSQNVVELHGSVWQVRCMDCDEISEDYPLELPIPARCDECGALLRPNVIWFGEMLEPAVLEAAEIAVQACDLFIVVGTSAVVQPAASFPLLAARRGVPIIEVNTELTPISVFAAAALQGPAEILLPQLL